MTSELNEDDDSKQQEILYPNALAKMNIHNLEDWRKVYENEKDFHHKNKIMQIVFQNFYRKYKANTKILIHCSLGVSRSSTICIMYIMKKFKLPFQEVYDFVKYQREKSNPIDSFQYELEDFEKNEFSFDYDK